MTKKHYAALFLSLVLGVLLAFVSAEWFSIRLFFINDPVYAAQVGDHYLNGGAYDITKAQKAFLKSVALDPTEPWVNYKLARTYFVQGEQQKALEAANREFQLNPNNSRAFYLRGLIHVALEDYGAAADDFRIFTEKVPTEWAGYNDLSWALALKGDYAGAREAALLGIEKAYEGDTNPWLFNSLGVALLNEGEYTEAEAAFAKAQEFAAHLTVADWVLAYTGNDPSDATQGLQNFRDAIDKNLKRIQEAEDFLIE